MQLCTLGRVARASVRRHFGGGTSHRYFGVGVQFTGRCPRSVSLTTAALCAAKCAPNVTTFAKMFVLLLVALRLGPLRCPCCAGLGGGIGSLGRRDVVVPVASAARAACCTVNGQCGTVGTGCTTCPIGKQAPTGCCLTCLRCGSGKYSYAEGAYQGCPDCPAGQYGDGSAPCSLCDVGRYSNAGVTSCSYCTYGKYSDTPGAAGSCPNCPGECGQVGIIDDNHDREGSAAVTAC